MDDKVYKSLVYIAIFLTLAWISWTIYDSFFAHVEPGDNAYLAGNNFFQDGHYQNALIEYEHALQKNPLHIYALRGKARALLQLGEYERALRNFDEAISREPTFAGTYANRGILYDRMGQHEAALKDYDKALNMDKSVSDGPGWLTRFFRLQPEKPPTIAERAAYLRQQLALPKDQRLLKLPEVDEQQRPYQQ